MTLTPFSSVSSRSVNRNVGKSSQALVVMGIVTLMMLIGIGSRLAYLQLYQTEQSRQEAENNRVRLLPKQPGRGNIFDRNGKLLASSRLSRAVFLWPLEQEPHEWPATLKRLSKLLNIPEAELKERLEKVGYESPLPVRVARGLGAEHATALEEYAVELKGVKVDVEAIRYYPHNKSAAHILGYTGETNDRDLTTLKERGYRLGDIIGQMGVEAAFEKKLRGEWGGQEVEVDSTGQILRTLGEKAAKAGQDVHLTIDLELQKAAEKALGNYKGAVVAMDPNNGAVFAMASYPAFDPNVFSGRISDRSWAELQGEGHPFVNRAIQGFPPASTFKIVTTAAAIESGKYSPYTVLPTYPYVQAGGIKFWDWNRAGFGPLGFVGALAWSSDTFFYQIAMGIGGEILIDWTRRFGFGSKTGIELASEEAAGLVADDRWKREEIGEEWLLGDTINMSIGQGFLLASPLQVAIMTAVPANGGYKVKPHLLKDDEESKSWRESLELQPETVEILRTGLRDVVIAGTGGALNVTTLPPNAGKTGTAEDPPRLSHAWYGGYAPFDKPEIVVVVFGENTGGGGGSFAAPIAREVMEAYFKNKKK
ncbi:penicillin-binding protein 2 [Oxynema aestuarii]|jgi:penicillin-binding protein 2|uniref:Penicillin-binding protein 2 n=1 Tax=Oxynema aestuarii AP17 TaxID=2064643 RepID=A0A6H1U1M0_9CYAN|nr:penicillin-binding protein 2 [Oxynema aestuarii]QIZ72734.1 penicillin-binding protein 2 [Oxynema aestuarii AP17]RMH75762.1 MAG: penicillin-binding protein 2 [Cyanobacteria bacterium J007]